MHHKNSRREFVFLLSGLIFFSIYWSVQPNNLHSKKKTSWLFSFPSIGESSIMFVPTSSAWRAPVGSFPQLNLTHSLSQVENSAAVNLKLPVVSITIDNGDFFDNKHGIYVRGFHGLTQLNRNFHPAWWDIIGNYSGRGKQWSRNGKIDFFDRKGNCIYSDKASFRIHGNATRGFPQKSLRITTLNKKKKNLFPGSVFGDKNSEALYSSLILRNGGNDWGRTMIADEVMQQVVSNNVLMAQRYFPYVLYVNGQYWGLHNLRTRIDKSFIASRENVKKKQVTLTEDGRLDSGSEKNHFYTMRIIDNMSKAPHATSAYVLLENTFDMENVCAYLAAQIFIANTDWPVNNVKRYSVNNGKWKYVLYDLDYGFGYTGVDEMVECDMFNHVLRSRGEMGVILKVLLCSPEGRRKLKKSIIELMNSSCRPAEIEKVVVSYSKHIRLEMPNQIRRWRKPRSMVQWQIYVQDLIRFGNQRSKYLQTQIKKYLK